MDAEGQGEDFVKIDGSFIINAPIDRVWTFITTPELVAPCVPGCEGYEEIGPDQYSARVKVALGPIKTRFSMLVDVVEQRAPLFWSAKVRGDEGGKASSLTADSQLELVDLGDGRTEVSYRSEVSIFGRLGKFGLGMMKKQAEKISAEFAVAFGTIVENAEPTRAG